jgi:peptidoglycan/LPS O-acetylase OafA/YrhL
MDWHRVDLLERSTTPVQESALPEAVRQPASMQPASLGHVPALDGVRGLAVLLVLLSHCTPDAPLDWGLGGATAESPYGEWGAAWLLLRWWRVGWAGVDVFFVLSGFLITRVLLEARGKPRYFRNFFARRFLRIFPLYYGVLFALFVLVPAAMALTQLQPRVMAAFGEQYRHYQYLQQNQAWLWLYGTNLGTVFDGHAWGELGHFWSLAVEEHFYVVWPFLVTCLSLRKLTLACLLCVFGAPVLRAGMLGAGFAQGDVYVFTPCRIDGLALGALLAIASISETALPRLARFRSLLFWTSFGALVGLFAAQGTPGRESPVVAIAGHTLLAVFSAALMIFALSSEATGSGKRVLLHPWMVCLGKYSYGIYVLHRLLVFPLRRVVPIDTLASVLGSPLLAMIFFQAVAIAVSFCAAVASWHLYEAHFLRLKKHFA